MDTNVSHTEQPETANNVLTEDETTEPNMPILNNKRERTLSAGASGYGPSKFQKSIAGSATASPFVVVDSPSQGSIKNSPGSLTNKPGGRLTLITLQAEMRSMAATFNQTLDSKFDRLLNELQSMVSKTVHEEVSTLTHQVNNLSERMDKLHDNMHGLSEGVTRDISDMREMVRNVQTEMETCQKFTKSEINKQASLLSKETEESKGAVDNLKIEMKNKTSNVEHNELKSVVNEQQNNIAKLEEANKVLTDTLTQQQRFLNTVDAERRASNIIITGVMESGEGGIALQYNDVSAVTDMEKVCLLMQVLGTNHTEITSVQRLGELQEDQEDQRPRPIKVVLKEKQDRKPILSNAKKLKEAGEMFSKIYINKDMHPGERKEWSRIRKVIKEERARPDNHGRNVVFDYKNHNVLVDGLVVDRYRPSFL
jgi:hypothetical protein